MKKVEGKLGENSEESDKKKTNKTTRNTESRVYVRRLKELS